MSYIPRPINTKSVILSQGLTELTERLWQLNETFLADYHSPCVQSGALRILGLHGMSGAVKSLLAASLVKDYTIRRAHRDGVFWVKVGRLGDLVVLQQGLARLLDCSKTSFFKPAR